MHHSVESMRDRAFLKGRTAFRSDAEYNAALRGEIDDLDETAQEQREDDGMAGHYADPAEAFRDILSGTPDLDEDDLDCIAATLRNFWSGLSREPLVYAGHFTLKPAIDNSREAIVVNVYGEFAVNIDDALGVLSEMAEAMECAESSRTEPAAESGGLEDPVLAALAEGLDEDDLDEVFDFVKYDKGFGDLELSCGKFLRWRHKAVTGTEKFIVVDDPDAQTWSAHDAPDIMTAAVAAGRRMRCEKLADALAELDGYDEKQSAKVLAIAKDVERGMYADGKKFELTDEDGGWIADVSVCTDGRVVVDVDACSQSVEVSKEDFVKVTKKFFEGFGGACSQGRLEKLEEMLDHIPDAALNKLVEAARQVVANGYSVGIRLEIEDEDDQWVADMKILPEGKVCFETDDGAVEVSGKELLETAKAAVGI